MFSYTATTATYTYRRPLSTLLPLPFFCGPRLGPAFQQGPQRLCRGIIPFERQGFGEQDEAALQPSQPREQRGERRQRVPGDLDERNIHAFGLKCCDNRFGKAGLAHAARSPKQHVLRRQSVGEAARVAKQRLLLRIDSGQSLQRKRPEIRSEERRVGKEWVSTCRSRWST